MIVRICVSILPKTVTEALSLIEKAQKCEADFIEVRLDCLENCSELGDLANHGDVPLIATNRSLNCQGRFSGSETERLKILLDAAKNGFEYVDVESYIPRLRDFVIGLKRLDAKVILSFHDFDETLSLSGLYRVLEKEIANGADVCKIVTTAKHIEDNLTLLDFMSKACKNAKIVCFSMGELGKISRLFSPMFGGFFTIASIEKGRETAFGQMTIQEMRVAYQALGLT